MLDSIYHMTLRLLSRKNVIILSLCMHCCALLILLHGVFHSQT